jgi:hypothetical protein
MKGINHLVLCANDLTSIRQLYSDLGFTLCPAGQHPFGTGNTIIQLHGTYLELLSVTRPDDVVEHGPDAFSFSAFNRDYLSRHEGFSMMVLDSDSASEDISAWKKAGLTTYAPFEFSRVARMPDDSDVKVGFSLAFVSNEAAPWLGLFACQHYRPEYYAQAMYQAHANGAHHLEDVWISGPGAIDLAPYLTEVAGTLSVPRGDGRIDQPTRYGTIILADAGRFENAFGVPPPNPEDGPHLAGLTIASEGSADLPNTTLKKVGRRMVVSSTNAHGTAFAFISISERLA